MDNFEHNKNVEDLLRDVATLPISALAYLVQYLEHSELGKLVVHKNPNRKLYAVARPTSDEYLQRFRALLDLDGEEGAMWRAWVRLLLPILKFSEYMTIYYQSGQISCVAYNDLIKKLLWVFSGELANVLVTDFFKQDFWQWQNQ